MLYWVRGDKLLAVVHFIYFLRILQKLSNILHPSRQNWTTEVCFLLQKEDNSWKYMSQLLLSSYFILVCLNEKYWLLLILFLHVIDKGLPFFLTFPFKKNPVTYSAKTSLVQFPRGVGRRKTSFIINFYQYSAFLKANIKNNKSTAQKFQIIQYTTENFQSVLVTSCQDVYYFWG